MTEPLHADPDTTTTAGAAADPAATTAAPEQRRRGGEQLVMFLERDQLVLDAARPVPRAPLGARAKLALWALRVFVIVLSAMVIYTFAAQLTR